MPVVWNFRKWLAVNRDIYRPSQLQELIAQRVGVYISIQTLSGLMNGAPDGIRFKTMQAICDALECDSTDFFYIQHDVLKKQPSQKKVVGDLPPLYGKKTQKQQSKQQERENNIYPEFRLLEESEGKDEGGEKG